MKTHRLVKEELGMCIETDLGTRQLDEALTGHPLVFMVEMKH